MAGTGRRLGQAGLPARRTEPSHHPFTTEYQNIQHDEQESLPFTLPSLNKLRTGAAPVQGAFCVLGPSHESTSGLETGGLVWLRAAGARTGTVRDPGSRISLGRPPRMRFPHSAQPYGLFSCCIPPVDGPAGQRYRAVLRYSLLPC